MGKLEKNYIKLDNEVFNIENNVFIDKTIDIKSNFIKYFVSYNNISIIKAIDRVVKKDIYIDKSYIEDNANHISFDTFKRLISVFPNSTELKRYSENRIAQILTEFFEGMEKYRILYEKHLEKKETRLNLKSEKYYGGNIKKDTY